MPHTQSITRRIKERNSAVNTDINFKIKHLQRLLVSYSFTKGSNSSQYFKILGQIKSLRSEIFNGKTA